MTLVNTRLYSLVAGYEGKLDRNENRISTKGLLVAAQQGGQSMASILPTNIQDLAQRSFNRTMNVPVMDKFETTLLTGRPVAISTTTGTSAMSAVSFTTTGFNITLNPAYYENNFITAQDDFNKQLSAGVEKVERHIEDLIVTGLDANLNQQYASTLAETDYGVSSNVIQVTKAQKFLFIEDMATILEENDFTSNDMIVVAKTGYKSTVMYVDNQGEYNSVNEAYQLSGKNFYFSNRIAGGGGLAEIYFMPQGTIGLITRNDFDSQARRKTSDGKSWDIVMLGENGLMFDVYSYEAAEDLNAVDASTTGNTRTKVEKYSFALDVAIVLPYNSNAGTAVTDESVTITALGTAYALAHSNVSLSGVVVTPTPHGGTVFVEGTDYSIDYLTGTITGISTGAISAGDAVLVDYIWGEASAVCKALQKTT